MCLHKICIFGGEEYPFFTLLGSSFLFDDLLYGPTHQPGSSCHQYSHWTGVVALTAHLENRQENLSVKQKN